MPPSPSLTTHLLTLHSPLLSSATTHPFLTAAGAGTLASSPLCTWLVQDKHYQKAYVAFIGRLLAKLDLESYDLSTAGDNTVWDTLSALVAALTAIKAEIEFYDRTVQKYGLRLEEEGGGRGMAAVTRDYVRLFEESSALGSGVGMVEGLTVLWATEHVYLRAWSHAKAQKSEQSSSMSSDVSPAVSALHKEFIPNWTSEEFEGAVKELARLADAWAAKRVDEEKGDWIECEALWKRVLELETDFWPKV